MTSFENTSSELFEAARSEYRQALADLTFNSKPIITTLTIIAHENLTAAPAIAQAIEDQIRNVNPKIKLPLLYLLDSILKNVGDVYIHLFSKSIIKIFTAAYDTLSIDDKSRLVKVLETWRNSPTGNIFPIKVIEELERFVRERLRMISAPKFTVSRFLNQVVNSQPLPSSFMNQNLQMMPTPPAFEFRKANLPINAAVSSPQSLILQNQIQSLLTKKQSLLLLNPLDQVASSQSLVLTQLLTLVKTTVLDSVSLAQISSQISSMMYTAQPSLLSNSSNIPYLSDRSITPPKESIFITKLSQLPRISLTNEDINKNYAGAVELLYKALEIQCKQCGVRYEKSEESRIKMEEHMDWHFRENRRARDSNKRPPSRDWYLQETDWMLETLSADTIAVVPDVDIKVDEIKIEEFIPAEGEIQRCETCHEVLEKFYDEDKEEWMLKDAVKRNAKFYHRHCLTDSIINTPTRSLSPATLDVAALGKRKLHDNLVNALGGDKKFKLESE